MKLCDPMVRLLWYADTEAMKSYTSVLHFSLHLVAAAVFVRVWPTAGLGERHAVAGEVGAHPDVSTVSSEFFYISRSTIHLSTKCTVLSAWIISIRNWSSFVIPTTAESRMQQIRM